MLQYLGVVYANQGELNAAEEMFQRALNGCEKTLGPDHISTLQTAGNLGSLYVNQGKLTEAEDMYLAVVCRL
jgi:tetratricopeptide (TPR) repeat protein